MGTWSGIAMALLILVLLGTWLHAIVTYDWTRFDEDKRLVDEDPHSPFP